MTQTATSKIIDLRFRSSCPKLHARFVWQELFRWYRNHGGNLDCDLDSFLCDLYTLARFLEKGVSVFWWDVDLETGYTELLDYNLGPNAIKIEVEATKITLTFPD